MTRKTEKMRYVLKEIEIFDHNTKITKNTNNTNKTNNLEKMIW